MQSAKIGLHAVSFRFLPDYAPLSFGLFTPRCLHPPPLADNHKAGLSFLHSFPFSPTTALARKELSQLSLCGHPNSEVESSFAGILSSYSLGFHRLEVRRRGKGGECVTCRGTQTRDRARELCGSTPAEKET